MRWLASFWNFFFRYSFDLELQRFQHAHDVLLEEKKRQSRRRQKVG